MKKKIILFILLLMTGYSVMAEKEATLKNIKVNNVACTCVSFTCTVELDASKATVTYELDDPNATVDRLSGFTTDLISSSTTMKVTVTNDKGEEKIENIYTIIVNKHQKSDDVSLKEFSINDEEIKILEDVYVYNCTVKYDAELLKINMVPNDSKATITSKLEQDFPLDKSSLAIDLDVMAENGNTQTYRVVVFRGEKPDTLLKKLVVAKKEIELKDTKLEYDIVLDYSISSPTIEAVANSKDATVEIIQEDLVVGENEIKVIVKNKNATSEYILHVIREENKDKSVANLKKLVISEYPKLDFEPNVLEYTLKFSEIPQKLDIKATPVTKDAIVEILYNEDLSNKDKILIRVSLEDSDILREYILTVVEEEQEEDSKLLVIIGLIGVIIAIIVMAIMEVVDRKKQKKLEITRILELKKKKDREKTLTKAKDKIKEKLLKEKKGKQAVPPKEDDIEII